MQAFSTKCCANLAPYGCHISEEIHRSDGGKLQYTQQSRASHFLSWTKRMDLGQDPCLPHQEIQVRNYLIACFAVPLVRGETINSHKIRHATVRNYVNTAASLHTDRKLPSPYSAPIDYITIVLKAIKKYEKQPRRRNMIYDKMFHQMESTRHQY